MEGDERGADVRRVAVIGAGVMGAGIAQVCAEAGLEVRLWSRSDARLDAALARIRENQAEMQAGGLHVPAGAIDRIAPTDDLALAVGEADFVSENVVEDLEAKRALFRQLDRLAPAEAILATDTSGLSITAIASATGRAERVVGFHWLNPPHLMLPVEVNRGELTSEATMRAACELANRLGRWPIRVERDVPGFLWNRLQLALLREALDLVDSGVATPEDIDLAVQSGLGLRWAAVGPLRVVDLAGLATFRAVAASLYPALSAARVPQAALEQRLARGASGARAGEGFYAYPGDSHAALIRERDRRLMALRRLVADGPGHRP